jgi:membrane-bound lytic murein transglycosylase B
MKILTKTIFFLLILINFAYCENSDQFKTWLNNFSIIAKNKGISDKTINSILIKAKFLPKVIEYDRRQPEFYEDTKTYIGKRSGKNKVNKAIKIFKKNHQLIIKVEKEYNIEKELLLSLMGIETNFGTYLGKMDIISSLATLSFDERRSAFFSNELITLLKLVDNKIVKPEILFGSWAGAVGNFQFMPTTIKKYAIDYNDDGNIDLKKIEDSIASAANYLNKMGWKKNQPCFKKIILNDNIPKKYLNSSAKKINNRIEFKNIKKYIKKFNKLSIDPNTMVAIITPDKDIVPDSQLYSPAYLIFDNYQLILKWNRSLRFGLAVCTLFKEIKNEI